MRLARAYSEARTQAATERALPTGACRCSSVESILKNSLVSMRCKWTTQTSDWKRAHRMVSVRRPDTTDNDRI